MASRLWPTSPPRAIWPVRSAKGLPMDSTSPDSEAARSTPAEGAASAPGGLATYFDGLSNRRQTVTVSFANQLVMRSADNYVSWPYDDIRRADAPSGTLRVGWLSA